MAKSGELRVSSRGQMSLPVEARRRWRLHSGGEVAFLDLPAEIELVSLRHLAPDIVRLRQSHELNILGMEVLAAAVRLSAEVALSSPSPRLQDALDAEGCRWRRFD